MKKSALLLLSILLTTSLLMSCDDKEEKRFFIELDQTSLTIDLAGNSQIITLRASGEWQVTNVPEWLELVPVKEGALTEVIVKATENTGFEKREAKLLFSCGEASDILEVEQLGIADTDAFLRLNNYSLYLSVDGQEEKVQLTTNRHWEVKDVPDWLYVSPRSGTYSAEITVRVQENREPKGRGHILLFTCEGKEVELVVTQPGLGDVVWGVILPITSFNRIRYTQGGLHEVWTNTLFINHNSRDKVYMGNLLSHNAGSHLNIPEFTGYTFNPITISTSAPVSLQPKTYIPSKTEQDAYAWQVAGLLPPKTNSFKESSGSVEFYDYRQLHTLGIMSLGMELDKVVSGAPFAEKEMQRKYGLIYSFKQTYFTLDMDVPGALIKEELSTADKAKGVSYVSSVTYGKVGVLVIESDADSRYVKPVIDKLIADESLSPQEVALLETVDATYVYYDNDKTVQVKKGGVDAIDVYKASQLMQATDNNMYPLEFRMSDFADHSASMIEFSFTVSR